MGLDRVGVFGIAARTRSEAEDASPLEREVTALFDQWRDPLLCYVITLGLPVYEGEEVVQEVFLALFQHLNRGKSKENLRGWIFRVGHNIAVKRRSIAGRQKMEHIEENSLHSVQDQTANPEQAFAMKQRQSRLLAVVSALPEQDRCCLHLRAEGLRYREIADVLGMSLGSVAISLSRSLQRLQRADKE